VLLAPPAFAQQPPAFVASRPGATEGAIAVPAGYLQSETEIASWARTRQDGFRSDAYSLAATSLRYGVADGLDVELNVQPYLHGSVTTGGAKDSKGGFGDVTLRVLKNLTGQDGEGPALAVIGYVTLPTAKNGIGADKTEGGAIITGSFTPADAWGVAWTLGAAARYQGGGNDYQAEFSGALQLNHAFTNVVTGYAEVAAVRAQHDDGPVSATFDVGAAWVVAPTTQLDAGVNFGLTDAADDANVFVGVAHRF
jgi:hypothetical protein